MILISIWMSYSEERHTVQAYFGELGLIYLVRNFTGTYLFMKVDFELEQAGELTFYSSTSLKPTILGAGISYRTFECQPFRITRYAY